MNKDISDDEYKKMKADIIDMLAKNTILQHDYIAKIINNNKKYEEFCELSKLLEDYIGVREEYTVKLEKSNGRSFNKKINELDFDIEKISKKINELEADIRIDINKALDQEIVMLKENNFTKRELIILRLKSYLIISDIGKFKDLKEISKASVQYPEICQKPPIAYQNNFTTNQEPPKNHKNQLEIEDINDSRHQFSVYKK